MPMSRRSSKRLLYGRRTIAGSVQCSPSLPPSGGLSDTIAFRVSFCRESFPFTTSSCALSASRRDAARRGDSVMVNRGVDVCCQTDNLRIFQFTTRNAALECLRSSLTAARCCELQGRTLKPPRCLPTTSEAIVSCRSLESNQHDRKLFSRIPLSYSEPNFSDENYFRASRYVFCVSSKTHSFDKKKKQNIGPRYSEEKLKNSKPPARRRGAFAVRCRPNSPGALLCDGVSGSLQGKLVMCT